MVTSEGIGYTYYTSCQFGHHKGSNHFDLVFMKGEYFRHGKV
jgi:hypothetical protein